MRREAPVLHKKQERALLSQRVVLHRVVPLVVILLLLTSVFLNLSMVEQEQKQHQQQQQQQQQINNHINHIPKITTCDPVPQQTTATTKSKPIWIPGYPGSGSELLRELIPTITGFRADDVYADTGMQKGPTMSCGSPQTITCKTHWPMVSKRHPWRPARLERMSRNVFLLLRNPMHALPSHFNFVWEASQSKQPDHTVQAPEQAWREWRDKNFQEQLQIWVKTIVRWHTDPLPGADKKNDEEPYFRVVFYMSYEELIQESTGPRLAQDLLDALRKQGHHPVAVAPSANVTATTAIATDETTSTISLQTTDAAMMMMMACLWRRVVKERPRKKRKTHSYTPGFTPWQKKVFLRALHKRLLTEEWVQQRAELYRILKGYEQDIQTNLRLDTRADAGR